MGWLIISPVVMEIDTRIPRAGLRWISVGNVWIWYENEWWLSFRILFYRKTIRFSEIKSRQQKIEKEPPGKRSKTKIRTSRLLKKMIRVIKTFRVAEWQVAIDTGDHPRNAQLYPLNYMPYTFTHVRINFDDENHLVLKIRNRPLEMIYAFLR
jgi:hypothetical protein